MMFREGDPIAVATHKGFRAPRAAVYARVSHLGPDQNPEAQLIELREFARGRGWTVVDEYVDRGSAVRMQNDRPLPAWARLWQDARRRRFDLVLVVKLDRAFRSALHALTSVGELRAYGVDFLCTSQPIDTTSSAGRMVFTMLAAVAEMERDLISERTKAGHARAIAEGKRLGRPKGSKDKKRRLRKGQGPRYRLRLDRYVA